jgi:hypothetical protein
MRSEKAIVTSRRESRSDALGIALVTASTWPIRADQARSMHGQSNSSTSNSGHTTQNISLKWDVFLAPSIPAITSDLAPGEKERPWPPISSTLISGERDAVLVDTPITVEQARALANWVAASGKNLTTIYTTHVDRLPGVGKVTEERLKQLEVQTGSGNKNESISSGCMTKSPSGFFQSEAIFARNLFGATPAEAVSFSSVRICSRIVRATC